MKPRKGSGMNEDQYEIEKAGEDSIQIRDLTTGIRFTFVIIDRKLNGIVGLNRILMTQLCEIKPDHSLSGPPAHED